MKVGLGRRESLGVVAGLVVVCCGVVGGVRGSVDDSAGVGFEGVASVSEDLLGGALFGVSAEV